METVDLLNVPIFSVGTWEGKGSAPGGDVINDKFLDDIVKSFEQVGSRVKPRMVLTHNKGASKTATGMASLGWITKLSTKAGKLYADIKKVPKKIADAINAGAFARFSPGIFTKINLNGIDYTNVLEHLALLGADLPANTDLDGLIDLYYSKDEYSIDNFVTYETEKPDIINDDKTSIGEKTMDEQYFKDKLIELEKFNAELSEKLASYEKNIEQLESEKLELQSQVESVEQSAYSKEVEIFVDQQIDKGKLLPSQKPAIMALASEMGNEKTFSYSDGKEVKEIKGNNLELIKQFVDNQPKVVDFSETSSHEEIDLTEKSEDDIIDEKARAYAKEHNIEYREALIEVSRGE